MNVKAEDDTTLGGFRAKAFGWGVSGEGPGVTNLEPEGCDWPVPCTVSSDLVRVPDPEPVKYRIHHELATTRGDLGERRRRHQREQALRPRGSADGSHREGDHRQGYQQTGVVSLVGGGLEDVTSVLELFHQPGGLDDEDPVGAGGVRQGKGVVVRRREHVL